MFMFMDSDLDEEDIKILKECLKKSKKKKKRSKKFTQKENNDDLMSDVGQKDSIHLIKCDDGQKTIKRKLDDTLTEETEHKIRRKGHNSRLERIIKNKNRRHAIPLESKLSPLYKENEFSWTDMKNGIISSTVSSDSNDSDFESLSSTCSVKDCDENISCTDTLKGDKTECVCNINVRTCTCITFTSNLINNNISDNSQYKIPNPDTIVAIDCEFVGVQPKNTSALGRCSIVDFHGNILYDKYVKPEECITTYRTKWSGIRKCHLRHALKFSAAQQQIREIIQGKIVVGHSVYNDFKVLQIEHSGKQTRDTAGHKPLRALANLSQRNPASLKNLSRILLGKSIQENEHCSVEDARATLDLYKLVRNSWEQKIVEKKIRRANRNTRDPDNLEIMSDISQHNNDKKFLSDEFWPQYLFPSESNI